MESSAEAVSQAKRCPMVYATVGVHPHDASKFRDGNEELLIQLCREKKVVAVGETGLDYHYNLSPKDTQQQVYRLHIRLAHTLGLPLVIHGREAGDDILDILDDEGMPDRGAVLHCFSGDADMAFRALEMGCYLGIAGPITFRNADDFRNMIEGLPLDSLLVETDAPYLAPHPHRGKRNEPAYVRIVAEKLAEVKGIPLSEVASVTTSNSERLFGLGM
jgi:TatD DNase family protein